MKERSLHILQVSTYDTIGGAELVARNLYESYRIRGYQSSLAVGQKLGNDPDILQISNAQQHGRWSRFWKKRKHAKNGSRLQNLLNALSEPTKALDQYRGIEDFRFPETWQILNLTNHSPDIVHCHNLHGGYFDLRVLPWLSRQVPLILTLHDAWLLSGHCAHSFECERWRTGCGHCPDLKIEPPVARDATAYNWERKRSIYAQSRIYISTPSEWLMQKVKGSMLMPAIVESRVIPNGVDLTIFHPGDRAKMRSELIIPQDAVVFLFAAHNIRRNIWKDYRMLRAALALIAEQLHGRNILFIALGEDAPSEHLGQAELRFVAYQKNKAMVAHYYQAADLYVHAAKVDTFPNTILESLACGTPVVATKVGGIPEQIVDARTGYLTPAGDAPAMANRILELVTDQARINNMRLEAVKDSHCRFDLNLQVDTYLEWYQKLVQKEEHALSIPKRLTASPCG